MNSTTGILYGRSGSASPSLTPPDLFSPQNETIRDTVYPPIIAMNSGSSSGMLSKGTQEVSAWRKPFRAADSAAAGCPDTARHHHAPATPRDGAALQYYPAQQPAAAAEGMMMGRRGLMNLNYGSDFGAAAAAPPCVSAAIIENVKREVGLWQLLWSDEAAAYLEVLNFAVADSVAEQQE